MFKGTSLAVLVSQTDFLFSLQKEAARTKENIPLYIFGIIVYFVCSFTISRSGVWLGRRMRHALAT
jgi:ABC-type amino acid transport system permease subunit